MSKFFVTCLLVLLRSWSGSCSCVREDVDTCVGRIYCDDNLNDYIDTITSKICGHYEYICDHRYCRNEFQNGENELYLNLYNIDTQHTSWYDDIDENMLYKNVLALNITKGTKIPDKIFRFSKLEDIHIVDSLVETLDLNKFTTLPHLGELNVSHCSISVLENSPGNDTASNVFSIDLSYNQIKSIPNNYFQLYPKLLFLNMSHNELTNFDILTFEGMSQLQIFLLSYNQLQEIGHTFARFINLIYLGLNHNNLTSITEPNFKAMAQLTFLNLNKNQISDIEDNAFQGLSMLTGINLRFNRLTSITKDMFKSNHRLSQLRLSYNNITKIDSEAFKENIISHLDFRKNSLVGVLDRHTFAGVDTDELDLSGCKLTDLGSEAFTELHVRSLNLSSNELKNIADTSFKDVHNLKELDLSNNQLEDIGFDTTNVTELEKLNVRNNKLRNITKTNFEHLTSLVELDLSYNKLSEIEDTIFEKLEKLESLDISNNLFLNALSSGVFQGLSAVKYIELSHTRVTSILNDTFSDLHSLENLNCSHGELSTVEYNAFKNTSLKNLDLSYNLLEDFFVNTTGIKLIEELHLNNNRLHNIFGDTFTGLLYLNYLNLSDNNIAFIDHKALSSSINLKTLDLSSNPLQSVNVFENLSYLDHVYLANIDQSISYQNSTNTSIKELDLSRNKFENITSLFIYKVQKIHVLDLSFNKITFVDKFCFQNMLTLSVLDLSFNLISFIQPGSFLQTKNIEMLNLHGNLLPSIQFGALDGLQNLLSLNLSNNVITEFNKNLLHTMPLITNLALDDNIIKDIDFDAFLATNIKKISIGGNMISCHVFADEKIQHSYKFNVTAEKLDFHSENVNGITCQSTSNHTIDVNTTSALLAFSSALDEFRSTISKAILNFTSSMNNVGKQSTDSNITNILHDILKNNNEMLINNNLTQTETNSYLKEVMKQLIISNNRSIAHTLNVENVINKTAFEKGGNDNDLESDQVNDELKVKMMDEIRAIFQNLINTQNPSHNEALTTEMNGIDNMKALLYVIAICVTIIVIMFVVIAVHTFLKTNYRNHSHNTNGSSHALANSLEL